MSPNRDPQEMPAVLKIFALLVIVGVVADIIDGFAYWFFLSNNGMSFWATPNWAMRWDYLASFPGGVLMLLGLAPWLFALVWLWWPHADCAGSK